MGLRYIVRRTPSLPYSTPDNLPSRPVHRADSPRPNLLPRNTDILPRDTGSIGGGYIALIVILVLVVVSNIVVAAYFIHRRRQRQTRLRLHSPYPTLIGEKRQTRRSWQQFGSEWFGRRTNGEDTQSLVGYQSRMPSITISRPISNVTRTGPTPVFSTKQRESLHSIGIMELPAESTSPDPVYDPHTRSRSRDRSPSGGSLQSSRSRSGSPNDFVGRSRNSSISSTHSRSYSHGRAPRPLAQNSYSYARNRSPSNGPSGRSAYHEVLPETDEEHSPSLLKFSPSSSATPSPSSTSSSPSTARSSRNKSLPPPPGRRSTALSAHPSHLPRQGSPSLLEAYNDFSNKSPQFDFSEFETLHESTQVINIAISAPLDMPEGPLTPFGEREAKAGAAQGIQSAWYKSPSNLAKDSWLV